MSEQRFAAQTDPANDSGRFIWTGKREPRYCDHGYREDVFCQRCADLEAGAEELRERVKQRVNETMEARDKHSVFTALERVRGAL